MSSPEQQNPQPKPEFKLVMPSFPKPLSGIFEDVYVEYLDNPEHFLVSVGFRMQQEGSPSMQGFIDEENPGHILGIVSTKWPAIYYEIFSRSARGMGIPLPAISRQLAQGYIASELLRNEYVLDDIEARTEVYIKRDLDELRRRRDRDEALSPELAKFWNMVDQDINGKREEGLSETRILIYLLSLRAVQTLIQKQDDEYALAEEYLFK